MYPITFLVSTIEVTQVISHTRLPLRFSWCIIYDMDNRSGVHCVDIAPKHDSMPWS